MYPCNADPYFGIFVKEQLDELKQLDGLSTSLFYLQGSNFVAKYLGTFIRLFNHIKRVKPKIIHLHFGLTFIPLFFMLPWLKLTKTRLVLTTHGGDLVGASKLVNLITRFAVICVDEVINVSKDTNDITRKYNSSSNYIPCGVAPEFFVDDTKRVNTVIFPSSPSRPEKNYPRFLEIIEQVKLSITTDVSILCLENMNRVEVAQAMRSAKCMLLTSDYEGSPQAIKEAILCELPIVSVPVGDVPLLLKGQKKSVVSFDNEQLAKSVTQFLTSPPSCTYDKDLKASLSNKSATEKIYKIYKKLSD